MNEETYSNDYPLYKDKSDSWEFRGQNSIKFFFRSSYEKRVKHRYTVADDHYYWTSETWRKTNWLRLPLTSLRETYDRWLVVSANTVINIFNEWLC